MNAPFLPCELTFVDPIGRRSAPRLHLSVPARLMSVIDTRACMLVDISHTGARIRLERPLPVNNSGYLRIGPVEVFATALRRTRTAEGEGINGLEFDVRLSKPELLALIAYAKNHELAERRAIRAAARGYIMGGH